MTGSYSLVTVRDLTEETRRAVAQLAAFGAQHDGAEIVYYFEPSPAEEQASGVLCYAGDQSLIGFVAIQAGDEPEISGMVHPAYRRAGIGRALLAATCDACRQHGATHLLLTVNDASRAGVAFAAAVGAERVLGEYQMLLDPATIDRTKLRARALHVRQASAADLAAIVRVTAAAFDDPTDEVQDFVVPELGRADRRFYVADLDGEAIGSLRVSFGDDGVFITTLGVVPQHQGRGYGRQMLATLVDVLLTEGQHPILLEVAVDNRNALAVYHACGFHETAAYGYYRLALRD